MELSEIFSVKINKAPTTITAKELYDELKNIYSLRIIEVFQKFQHGRKELEYGELIDEYLVKPNKSLIDKMHSVPLNFQKNDIDRKDLVRLKKRYKDYILESQPQDILNTNSEPTPTKVMARKLNDQFTQLQNNQEFSKKQKKKREYYGSWRVTFFDAGYKKFSILQDIWVRDNFLRVEYENNPPEQKMPIYFTPNMVTLKSFEVCCLGTESVHRRYWNYDCLGNEEKPKDLKLVLVEELKNIMILNFSIGEVEIKVSANYYDLEAYQSGSEIIILLKLSHHPLCYYSPIVDDLYCAFEYKEWKRCLNFFNQAFTEEIDKIYISKKSALVLKFDKNLFEKNIRLQELVKDKWYADSSIFSLEDYYVKHLEANRLMINGTNEEHFQIKFMVYCLISRCIIDIYTFPGDFLQQIFSDQAFNEQRAIKILDFILVDRKLENQYLTHSQFQKRYAYYEELIDKKDRLIGSDEILRKFDSLSSYLFINSIAITPSGILYSYAHTRKSILKKFQIQQILSLLYVELLDEDLQPLFEPSSGLRDALKYEFGSELILMNKKFSFLSVAPDCLEEKCFWMYGVNEKVKDHPLQIFEKGRYIKDPKDYIKKVCTEISKAKSIYNLEDINLEIKEDLFKSKQMFRNYGFISSDLIDKMIENGLQSEVSCVTVRIADESFILIKKLELSKRTIVITHKLEWKFLEVLKIGYFKRLIINIELFRILQEYHDWSEKKIKKSFNQYVKGFYERYLDPLRFKDEDFMREAILTKQKRGLQCNEILTDVEFSNEPFKNLLKKRLHQCYERDYNGKNKFLERFGAKLIGIIDFTGTLQKNEIYFKLEGKNLGPNDPRLLVIRYPYLTRQDKRYFFISDQNPSKFEDILNAVVFSQHDAEFLSESFYPNNPYFILIWNRALVETFSEGEPIDEEGINPFKKQERQIIKEDLKDLKIEKQLEAEIQILVDDNGNNISLEDENDYSIEDVKLEDDNKINISNTTILASDFKTWLIQEAFKPIMLPYTHTIIDHYFSRMNFFGGPESLEIRELKRLLRSLKRYFNGTATISKKMLEKYFHIFQNTYFLKMPYSSCNICFQKFNQKSNPNDPESFDPTEYATQLLPYVKRIEEEEDSQQQKFQINFKLIHKNYPKYLKSALKFLILYSFDVKKLCEVYGYADEIDLLLGRKVKDQSHHHSHFNGVNPNFKKKFDNSNIYVDLLCKSYRKLFEEFKNKHRENELAVASAWYIASTFTLWHLYPEFQPLLKEYGNLIKTLKEISETHRLGFAWVSAYSTLQTLLSKQEQGK